MPTPNIQRDKNGVYWVENPDGTWSDTLPVKRDVSVGEFAKRVATHDIPEAFLGAANLATNLFDPTLGDIDTPPLSTYLNRRVVPEAPATDITEQDLSAVQRVTRDAAVGAATSVPFMLGGGPIAPIALGGLGGGAGTGLVRELDGGTAAQFVGGLVGGGLSAIAPGLTRAAGGGLGQLFTKKGQGAAALAAAERTLANRMQDRVRALSSLELPPRPPGHAMTLGTATEDVGLATLEAEMARNPLPQTSDVPGFSARLGQAQESEIARAAGRVGQVVPGTTDDVAAAQSTIRSDVNAATEKLRATGVGANPDVQSEQLYAALNETSKEVYAPIRARLDTLGKELGDAGIEFQPTQTRAALREIKKDAVFRELIAMKQEGEGQILGLIDNVVHRKNPAQTSPIVGPTGKPIVSDATDVPMSFNEEDSLRSYISELRKSKNRKLAKEANRLHDALEADLRDAVRGAPEGSIQAKYRAALDDFHTASVIYRRDVLEDVTNTRGSYKPETVLGRMWLRNGAKAGAASNARQLRTALGPRSQAGIDAIVADGFYASADPVSGVVNANKLAKYLREHKEALKHFPEAQDTLGQAMKTQRAAERLGITQNGAAIERASFAQFADDPDAAITDVLKKHGQERSRAISQYQAKFKGNASAEKGFQRLMWEHLSASAADETKGSILLNPQKLRSVIASEERTFRQVWGADSLPIFRRLADEFEQALSIPTPESVRTVPPLSSKASEAAHTSVRILVQRLYGAATQAVRGSEVVQGFVRKKTAMQAQKILEEAFLDPYGKGRVLLLAATKQNEARILQALGAKQTAASVTPSLTDREER